MKQEDNKLIAEFMGFTKDSENLYLIDDYSLRSDGEHQATYVNEMKFHSSWEWLMPVVEKIEETEVNGDYASMIIKQGSCEIEMFEYRKEQKDGEKLRVFFFQGSKIEATYKAVVEFIKWYNENK